jgi:hypothetical protein
VTEGATRDEAVARPRLPAAARPFRSLFPAARGRATPRVAQGRRQEPLATLYLLTLMSAADGSIVLLAASGHLSTLGGAVAVGLTVIAGAGSWLAAQEAFRGRLRRADHLRLALLGLATLAATVASAWLGASLGAAFRLHLLPKAAGAVLCMLAAEVAGLRVPRLRGVPLPAAALGGAFLLEAVAQWSLS